MASNANLEKLKAIAENREGNALLAALCSDALSLGVHWNYDLTNIAEHYPAGIKDFVAPGVTSMAGCHVGKKAGDLSHYGDQTLFLLEFLLQKKGASVDGFPEFWASKVAQTSPSFYRDHATKEAVVTFGDGGSKAAFASTELGGAARSAALFPFVASAEDFSQKAAQQAAFSHQSSISKSAAHFFAELTYLVGKSAAGTPVSDIVSELLERLAPTLDEEFVRFAKAGLASGLAGKDDVEMLKSIKPAKERTANGRTISFYSQMSCSLTEGAPAVLVHLITKYGSGDSSAGYEAAVISNAMLGGDSASRALVVGLVLGARAGVVVPARWAGSLNSHAVDDVFAAVQQVAH